MKYNVSSSEIVDAGDDIRFFPTSCCWHGQFHADVFGADTVSLFASVIIICMSMTSVVAQ
jgi:hypothetical protein